MANVSPYLGGIRAVKPTYQLDESGEESKLIAAIPKAPSKLFGNQDGEDSLQDFLVSDAFEVILAQLRAQHVIDMTETLGDNRGLAFCPPLISHDLPLKIHSDCPVALTQQLEDN